MQRCLFAAMLALASVLGRPVYCQVTTGPYVGVTFVTDFSTTRQTRFFPVQKSGSNFARSAGGFVGINFVSNSLLFGFEARGLTNVYAPKKTEVVRGTYNSLPFVKQFETCSGCVYEPPSTMKTSDSYQLNENDRFKSKFFASNSGDLSFRVGYVLDDFLFFGKAGGGAVDYSDQASIDQSKSQVCNGAIERTTYSHLQSGLRQITTTVIGCSSITGGNDSSASVDKEAPDGFIGFGAEYNFNPVFLRGELELHHSFIGDTGTSNSDEGVSYARIDLSVGVLF